MKTQHRKRRKITKAKLIKGINGSISILLCLLLAPFLSVALGMVEYARYQEAIEITDEIYELAGMSALSDYDKYIHDRFGLLATSQEGTLGNGYDTLLSENAKILGKQISVSNPSIGGKMHLADETLRKQVVDFSELTATTAVLADDLKLEELLNKLQGVSQFNDIMNTVDSLSDLADALSTAVDKLNALKTSLDNLKNSLTTATSNANNLVVKMAELYKKLGDNGIMLPEDATLEQIEIAIQSFTGTYLDNLKELYTLGKTLMDSINTIKTNLDTVKTSAEGFVSAVNNAKSALDNISSTNSADSDGSVSAAATGKLGDVLSRMTTLISGTLTNIKEESINTVKNALNEIINTALKDTGLAELATRYSEIASGSYFSDPLSDIAKQDLIDLLKTVNKVYTEKDPADHNPNVLLNGIKDYLKGKLVPNLGSINVENILRDIQEVISHATAALTQNTGDSFVQLMTKLVNVVKGLFDLDLFYEADLNAYVNIGSATNSSYQLFLDAIGRLFTAVDDFKSSLGGLNLFGMLDAIGDMFGAIWGLMDSIFEIVGDAVNSITGLGNSIVTGDVQSLYEKFLISGYMRHNLPCRLDSGTYSGGYAGGAATVKVSLTGKGLTGYDFDKIARPATYIGQSDSHAGFWGMDEAIRNLKNGYGPDKMFKGAELEYIRAGTNSEIANQVIVFFDIYFLRLLLDLPSVFMDGEVGAVAAAANIASWVVYILYIVAEPFCDTVLLVNGAKVPFIRTDCWLTATGAGTFINKLLSVVASPEMQNEINGSLKDKVNGFASTYASGDGDSETGLIAGDATEIDYRMTMLILLLIFVESDTQISRLQNLIELETTEYYIEQGKTFSMSKTYTVVEIGADVRFNPLFDLGLASGGSSLLPTKRITQFVGY